MKNIRRGAVVAAYGTALLLAASCGGGDGTPGEPATTIASVTIDPATVTLDVGATRQMQVIVKDSRGATVANPLVQWTSSQSTVASVSTDGLVTAVATGGPVTISAAVSGVKGNAAVSVSAPVASISIDWDGKPLEVGKPKLFKAILKDANGATLPARTVNWSSSNTAAAVVSANGTVTPVGRNGSATITASLGDKSASANVETWWQYGDRPPVALTGRTMTVTDAATGRLVPMRVRLPAGVTVSVPLVIVVPLPDPNGYLSRNFWEEQLSAFGFATFLLGTNTMSADVLCARFQVPTNDCFSLMHPTRLAAALDVKTVLDMLTETETRLGVTFDRNAIGIAGWSAGGAVAMYLTGATFQISQTVTNVSLAEPRIKAFLGNSPPAEATVNGSLSGFTNASWANVTAPVMIQTGAGDAPGRRAIYDNMPASGNKYLAWFGSTSIAHADFALDVVPPPFMVNNALAFFGHYLLSDTDGRAWLTTNQLSRATSGQSSISTK